MLQLERFKPSALQNLRELASRLERVIIRDSLNSLEELFDLEEPPIEWPRLRQLDCSHNVIPAIVSLV